MLPSFLKKVKRTAPFARTVRSASAISVVAVVVGVAKMVAISDGLEGFKESAKSLSQFQHHKVNTYFWNMQIFLHLSAKFFRPFRGLSGTASARRRLCHVIVIIYKNFWIVQGFAHFFCTKIFFIKKSTSLLHI